MSDPSREGEARAELFEDEEHPQQIVLCLLSEYEARDLIDKLERHGIGARVGNLQPDEMVEVVIHHFRLPEAQAVLVEFTGDPGMVDEVSGAADQEDEANDADESSRDAQEDTSYLPDAWIEASKRVWGRQPNVDVEPPSVEDVDDGDFVKISSSLADAERLERAGIDVRVEVPSPQEGWRYARVLVPRDDLARAREVLGIRL